MRRWRLREATSARSSSACAVSVDESGGGQKALLVLAARAGKACFLSGNLHTKDVGGHKEITAGEDQVISRSKKLGTTFDASLPCPPSFVNQ